jgi:hypothetical protein
MHTTALALPPAACGCAPNAQPLAFHVLIPWVACAQVCRAHQVVEDGYEFFADRQLVTVRTVPYSVRLMLMDSPTRPVRKGKHPSRRQQQACVRPPRASIKPHRLRGCLAVSQVFSAPNYCGEFDNAGAMMSVDENLMCSFQVLKPVAKTAMGRPNTPRK